MKSKGCWIFISHSSKDIETVRLIRNEFERLGQNPLAFHLKCLNTETVEGRIELEDLIKREIKARDWFVYCESAEAKKSQYVQMEREYVEALKKKMIWRIDLSRPITEVLAQVRKIVTDIHLLVLYADCDKEFVEPLIEEFIKKDYCILTGNDIHEGGYLQEHVSQELMKSAAYGAALMILTSGSIHSEYVMQEYMRAKSYNATIVIFIFDDSISISEAMDRYETRFVYRIPCIPRNSDMYLLTEFMDNVLQWKIDSTSFYISAAMCDAENALQERLNYEHCYHIMEPIKVKNMGASEDYCEVYRFPCCGRVVTTSDGFPKKERCDGCSKKTDENKTMPDSTADLCGDEVIEEKGEKPYHCSGRRRIRRNKTNQI